MTDTQSTLIPTLIQSPTQEEFEPAVPTTILVLHLLAVVVPFLGLLAAMVLLWGHYCSWLYVFMMIGGYVLTAGSITIGYHRLFTHRAFDANPVVKVILIILGSMSIQGSLFKWVAVHRKHHQHSDRLGDPHSPHLHDGSLWEMFTGLVHSHMGWIFKQDAADILIHAPDLAEDQLMNRISSLFPLWVALGLILPPLITGLITHTWKGALLGFLWGSLARIFVCHHMTWSINSICHIWGSRPFRTPDHSRNNPIFGVLSLGEGWHNNHHAFPTSARHGLQWWQFDLSYIVIRALAFLGLAWDLKLPAADAIAIKRSA
ncbi:MAG: acyl-CoA desaturase [Planctomycetota bacterium]|nr:acyl-CoA desaturase [Planctomycetota bacterium]